MRIEDAFLSWICAYKLLFEWRKALLTQSRSNFLFWSLAVGIV
jgi:hypothetical protein